MKWTYFLFSPEGRVSRRAYWLGLLLPVLLLGIGVGLAVPVLAFNRAMLILFAITLWPMIAVGAKRCHDRDRSGWFQLVYLIPAIGQVWLLIELGIRRGTIGQNRFGRDPLLEA
jgi:uncharacterized membrane protein YhaH (DUF805 family)